jgi:hypothetical protein
MNLNGKVALGLDATHKSCATESICRRCLERGARSTGLKLNKISVYHRVACVGSGVIRRNRFADVNGRISMRSDIFVAKIDDAY